MTELIPMTFMALPGSGSSQGAPQGAEAASVLPSARTRVAIVEDEMMVAWALETMLEELGHEVVGVYSNGEDALAGLPSEATDLICLDINLGKGIDGIETARRIREVQSTAVLFISAYSDEATKSRIMDAAPDAILLEKPVAVGPLRLAVAEIVGRS